MTENQKRAAIVVTVAVIALIIFLIGGRSNATTVNNGGNIPGVSVEGPNIERGPGFNFGNRPPFSLPPLGPQSNNLSAIGACCADCSGRTQLRSYVPATRGLTIVNNRGNSGPNIFNFFSPAPVTPPQRPIVWENRGVNVRMR